MHICGLINFSWKRRPWSFQLIALWLPMSWGKNVDSCYIWRIWSRYGQRMLWKFNVLNKLISFSFIMYNAVCLLPWLLICPIHLLDTCQLHYSAVLQQTVIGSHVITWSIFSKYSHYLQGQICMPWCQIACEWLYTWREIEKAIQKDIWIVKAQWPGKVLVKICRAELWVWIWTQNSDFT